MQDDNHVLHDAFRLDNVRAWLKRERPDRQIGTTLI
jgi:hypothetical protein